MDGEDDADANLPVYILCDCKDKHVTKILNCIGCGKCYFRSLIECNDDDGDYDSEDDLQHPDHGTIRWLCPNCKCLLDNHGAQNFFSFINIILEEKVKKHVEKVYPSSVPPQNQDLLIELGRETAEIKATLNQVVSRLDGLSPTIDAKSPKRKAARVAFGVNNDVSAIDFGLVMSDHIPSDNMIDGSVKTVRSNSLGESYGDKVKLNVKSSDKNFLKKLHENRHLVTGVTTRKKKHDGSFDILFNSFNEANKAKKLFDEKLNNVKIGSPSLDSLSKFNLVGLTFEMDKCEVIQSIIDENKNWLDLVKISDDTLSLHNDPYAVLTVGDIVKCRNNEVFQIVTSMSKRMFNFIGKRKLSVGYSLCHMYEIPNHGRCYKCQRPGHFARECPNPVACSRCSLEHSVQVCNSLCAKCVNCTLHSKDNVNHPSYSKLCPYNTSK